MARKSKGKRPDYAGAVLTDQLVSMVMALAGEVSVLRERLDTVERIAAEKDVLSSADIDAYEPDADTLAQRDKWRADYLDRVLWIVSAELEAREAGETNEGYADIVREISSQLENVRKPE
tara:strand:- start:330 stop:689 length:360 start_codon:yes stop_codon:yes gene_type:complete